ncbi:phytanoyl-CoA dioxygenase PhyH [Stella humosa]|uniref:Phytanoyl-CoA dioxygenase PhyH n=1 Tax=Stella humosa TaxID=94 RepID=A0A3N1LIN7_9PROT|nr:phytanoyl-CoA dioxygenase family protein [Stella humosa]ROP91212.1 phytanoyl-CoA dioxygenase PhyH [Stella humosa]BBK34435.1 non-ribosomal peptide synthase [Stella humosa]
MDGSTIGETYRQRGYCAPIPVLSAEDAGHYRTRLEQAEQAIGRTLTREERTKPHLLFGWAAELARHPAILERIEPLIGPDILCWETVLFTKEAGGPEFISWHQDLTYWGLEPGDQVITAWLALSPSTVESGCMRVVPGSHMLDLAPHRDTYDPDNLLSRGQEVAVEVKAGDWVDLVLAPGEMSLHHVNIVHGSDRNRSNDRRIGFAARYFATQVRQKSPRRDSAFLVAGQDRYGHFDLEPAPARDYSDEARTLHAEFRQRRRELQSSL